MDLTIAILIYDNESYKEDTNFMLDSLYNNYKNYNELLIIDDRRDQTEDLTDIFDLKRFNNYKIIKHKENKGILQSYISAISNIQTKWVYILDMDDFCTEFDFNRIDNDIDSDMITFIDKWVYTLSNAKNTIDFKTRIKYKCKSSMDELNNTQNMIYDKIFKYVNNDIINIKINNINERLIFYHKFCFYCPALWSKILNANFIRSCIQNINLKEFAKFNISADTLITLCIMDNISKISIFNDTLPYLHNEKNISKYINTVYNFETKVYKTNHDISTETIQSIEKIKDFLKLQNEPLKKKWEKLQYEYYKNSINLKNKKGVIQI